MGCFPLWRMLPRGPEVKKGLWGHLAYPGTSAQEKGKGCGKVGMGICPSSLKLEWAEEGQL